MHDPKVVDEDTHRSVASDPFVPPAKNGTLGKRGSCAEKNGGTCEAVLIALIPRSLHQDWELFHPQRASWAALLAAQKQFPDCCSTRNLAQHLLPSTLPSANPPPQDVEPLQRSDSVRSVLCLKSLGCPSKSNVTVDALLQAGGIRCYNLHHKKDLDMCRSVSSCCLPSPRKTS